MQKVIHGMSKTTERNSYKGMIQRCTNPKDPAYKNYGGRGIKVCNRWLNSFADFLTDMGKKPSPKHSLERRNNNKNYNKSNCYWATKPEQTRNTTRTVWIEYNGKRMVECDWAKFFGVDQSYLRGRRIRGKKSNEIIESLINLKKITP